MKCYRVHTLFLFMRQNSINALKQNNYIRELFTLLNELLY